MTLVLTAITKDYIIQAADRRITWVPDFRVETDDRVKAVLWGQVLFAFTGLAEMPRSAKYIKQKDEKSERIDVARWLSEVLLIAEPDTAMDFIAEEATSAFRELAKVYPRERLTHIFVGAYWGKRKDRGILVPHIVLIHNAADGTNFRQQGLYLAKGQKYYYLFSKPVNRVVEARFKRQFDRISKTNVSANALARLMVETIREAGRAQGQKRDIGYGINVSCIPRQVVEDFDRGVPIMIDGGPITNNAIRFRYFPPTEPSSGGFATSPRFVSQEAIAKSITIGAGGTLRIVPHGFVDAGMEPTAQDK